MAVFLFVAGIIKYGERIWALKLGSKKGLRNNTSAEVMRMSPEVEETETHWTYQEFVWYGALHTEEGVRDIFAGRKIADMRFPVRVICKKQVPMMWRGMREDTHNWTSKRWRLSLA
jgi:hypothetical protein